ncbi:MAG: sialate O-acetylesterase [Planctomycetia bacterium]|nr:sialate O-acetylesterase [Planctomycetia bacterium]
MRKNLKSELMFFAFCVLFCSAVFADVKMPSIFASKMVLQRDMKIPVWGEAAPSEKITIDFADKKWTVIADEKGAWSVKLDPMSAGGPYKMTVKGKNTLVFEDILIGDVWICSGQSNMGFTLKRAKNAEEEIKNSDLPNVRLMTVSCTGDTAPQKDVRVNSWALCGPKTSPNFTAVGYFFGKNLYQDLKIPIGLINVSWGGATCEAFVNPKLLAEVPELAPLIEPARLQSIKKTQYKAGYLYNGMICPIKGYAIRGAIWYQGESNASRAFQHDLLFPIMVQNWREEWGQGDFPFYFVQLANYQKVSDQPAESSWAEIRESQDRALSSVRNSGQAVIIDIGEANDIHPTNKQDVGFRLAAIALAKEYGKKVVYSGPRIRSMKIVDNKAILSFDHVEGGLMIKGDGPLKGFAVAGADRKFVWADAKIEGDTVVVSAKSVAAPVAVRYAWGSNPICNLFNKDGFPAAPFRTDHWPTITHKNR